jgi:hypothetical protein
LHPCFNFFSHAFNRRCSSQRKPYFVKHKAILPCFLLLLCSLIESKEVYAALINTFAVTPGSATFADQDPDLGQVTSSPALSITISISGLQQNQDWVLDISANTDLVSGENSIPAGNIKWFVAGSGNPTPTFYNSSLVKGVYLTVAQGKGNKKYEVAASVTLYFIQQNYWEYATGSYSGTITFRLSAAGGATQTQTIVLSTKIATRAKLILGSSAMSFPSANPDSMPSVPANVNPISVTSNARTGSLQSVKLTCLTSGDLISENSAIASSNVSWTATGAGYQPGTMNNIVLQNAGTWTGPGQHIGTFSYFFANSWSYTAGNYSTSVNYTLTVP